MARRKLSLRKNEEELAHDQLSGRRLIGRDKIADYKTQTQIFANQSELQWFFEAVRNVRDNLSEEYRPAPLAITRLAIFKELSWTSDKTSVPIPRSAVATYGTPRSLFITEAACKSRLVCFEEAAHSMDSRVPAQVFLRLRSKDDRRSHDDVIRDCIKILEQTENIHSSIAKTMPIRCHLEIFSAYLRFLNSDEVDPLEGEMERAESVVEQMTHDVCIERSAKGNCSCYFRSHMEV